MSQLSEPQPRYQCVLCGSKLEELPKNGFCPDCGAPNIRDVKETDGLFDDVDPKAVAHLKEPLGMCWNEARSPKDPNKYVGHKFVEKHRNVVNLSTSEYHDELFCETCGAVFGWPSGRAASADEIAEARAGKIPLKSKGYSGITGGWGR
jgi:hypothetical protein